MQKGMMQILIAVKCENVIYFENIWIVFIIRDIRLFKIHFWAK